MKKIAIIGAGITGISTVLHLHSLGIKKEQIFVFSKDIGGDYTKGGLKYILHTPDTKMFMDKVVGLQYVVNRINGAVLINGVVHPFPEYFWYSREIGDKVQRDYWVKTRKSMAGFDTRCMNEPWHYKNQLKIVPAIGIKPMMRVMIDRMKHMSNFIDTEIDTEVLAGMIKDYDLIIYTIPVFPLFNLLNIKPETELTSAKLTIHRFRVSGANKIWWEYLYVPHYEYPFHRLDINYNGEWNMDVEINNSEIPLSQTKIGVNKIIKTIYGKDVEIYNTELSSEIKIKGQITYDLPDSEIIEKIPKNVMMLGRYAEWNKRITWDIVLKKLNNTNFSEFVY